MKNKSFVTANNRVIIYRQKNIKYREHVLIIRIVKLDYPIILKNILLKEVAEDIKGITRNII